MLYAIQEKKAVIVICSYCKVVIDGINKAGVDESLLAVVVSDISKLANSFLELLLLFCQEGKQ